VVGNDNIDKQVELNSPSPFPRITNSKIEKNLSLDSIEYWEENNMLGIN